MKIKQGGQVTAIVDHSSRNADYCNYLLNGIGVENFSNGLRGEIAVALYDERTLEVELTGRRRCVCGPTFKDTAVCKICLKIASSFTLK